MPSRQRTILVVDDDPAMLLTAAANIELAGYRVLEAESGDRALDLVRERDDIDLILSDIRMPGKNGIELYREVKQLRPGLPVIMMTAFAVEDLVTDALTEGAYTVVLKPFDTGKVLETIAHAIHRPTVLVVDDNPGERESIAALLCSTGCRAAPAADAREALTILRSDAVDVAVIDLVMPGSDGVDTLRTLRAAHPALQVIMMTGYAVPDLVRQSAELGSYTCLRKPFDLRDITHALARIRRGG
jgi:DNA-binding NtrC family response regulator